MTDSIVAPNWYPDPNERGTERWWDGNAWTERTRAEVVTPPPTETVPADQASALAAPAQPPRPGGGTTVALIVIGILLFIGGWIYIGSAASLSTGDDSEYVNIPSLVTKSAGGLLIALLGAALFAAGLVRQHVADWTSWLSRSK